jgi:hypothetical protein
MGQRRAVTCWPAILPVHFSHTSISLNAADSNGLTVSVCNSLIVVLLMQRQDYQRGIHEEVHPHC